MRKSNVFDQLGFSREESDLAMMKTALITKIVRCAEHYSQAELQAILKTSQPRISNLLTGKIANFSLDTLIEYAAALNMRPEIRTHKPIVAMRAHEFDPDSFRRDCTCGWAATERKGFAVAALPATIFFLLVALFILDEENEVPEIVAWIWRRWVWRFRERADDAEGPA